VIELPVCRHRGEELPTGRFLCRSPKLITSTRGITADTCLRCPYVDHEIVDPPESPPEAADPPSLKAQIYEFLIALKTELRWLSLGGTPPTEGESTQRHKLCLVCSFRDQQTDRCTACGCYLRAESMPFLLRKTIGMGKTEMACQQCPIGKWGTVQGCQATGCGKVEIPGEDLAEIDGHAGELAEQIGRQLAPSEPPSP
jgi:hypothetical protein